MKVPSTIAAVQGLPHSLTTLEKINGKSAAEFWKGKDGN